MSNMSSRRIRGVGSGFRSPQSSTLFDSGFSYSTKLHSHTSCINALTFSRLGGRFLASGGDDLQVHIWDFHQEDVSEPCHTFIGPRGNIFCLEFSCSNQYLYAGGTDSIVHQFDVSQLERGTLAPTERMPKAIFRENDTIRDVTCHIHHDQLFLSASDSGRITRHDVRLRNSSNSARARASDIMQLTAEATSIKFHPTDEHLFLTSDSKSNVCLRDLRMAFGARKSRSNDGIVRSFHTTLARRNARHMSNPESSSICFDREGKKFAVTSLHYFPTIYTLSEPHPIAVCTGRDTVEAAAGQRTYSNSCTMKHGSFGGLESEYYCGGSDNFCGYLWKIPSVELLLEQREEMSARDWWLESSNTVGFTEGLDSSRLIPLEISKPSAILKGHQSIVNTTIIHPHFPLILTAGIEKTITLHSPLPSCPFTRRLAQTNPQVRQLSDNPNTEESRVVDSLLLGVDPADIDDPDESEADTIRLFDRILRMEGEADPFEVRHWLPDSDTEEQDSSDTDID